MRLRDLRQSTRVDRRDFLVGLAGLAAVPAEECRILLTRSSPRGECTTPTAVPRLVNVPLQAVENPQQAPVDVLVSSVSAGGAEERLGALSLFPVDRPAVFALRLHGAARIAFTLLPGPSPLAVEVGPLRWVYEEPR